jgi:hypothetical protein
MFHTKTVTSQVDMVRSHFIQSGSDNTAELNDTHPCESAAEHLEFIDSLLTASTYPFPVAEPVTGGVHSPNPTHRMSKAANT